MTNLVSFETISRLRSYEALSGEPFISLRKIFYIQKHQIEKP